MPGVVPDEAVPSALVAALRDRFGLTRAQFAAILRVTPGTIQRWELAPGTPGMARIRRDAARWLVLLATMPPAVFDPICDRVRQVFSVGPWPEGWDIGTIVNAR